MPGTSTHAINTAARSIYILPPHHTHLPLLPSPHSIPSPHLHPPVQICYARTHRPSPCCCCYWGFCCWPLRRAKRTHRPHRSSTTTRRSAQFVALRHDWPVWSAPPSARAAPAAARHPPPTCARPRRNCKPQQGSSVSRLVRNVHRSAR